MEDNTGMEKVGEWEKVGETDTSPPAETRPLGRKTKEGFYHAWEIGPFKGNTFSSKENLGNGCLATSGLIREPYEVGLLPSDVIMNDKRGLHKWWTETLGHKDGESVEEWQKRMVGKIEEQYKKVDGTPEGIKEWNEAKRLTTRLEYECCILQDIMHDAERFLGDMGWFHVCYYRMMAVAEFVEVEDHHYDVNRVDKRRAYFPQQRNLFTGYRKWIGQEEVQQGPGGDNKKKRKEKKETFFGGPGRYGWEARERFLGRTPKPRAEAEAEEEDYDEEYEDRRACEEEDRRACND